LESGLLRWAEETSILALPAINQFLGRVEKGLAYETAVLRGHDTAFCQRWLDSIERKLKSYNAYIAGKGHEWLIKK
jgi:hypothetical protein